MKKLLPIISRFCSSAFFFRCFISVNFLGNLNRLLNLVIKVIFTQSQLMNHTSLIKDLLKNKGVFHELLHDVPREQYTWKPSKDSWCLLEVLCHLHDEEKEDFRARVKHSMRTPELPLPAINPVEWVTERKYLEQDYEIMLANFENERVLSIEWLSDLQSPNWSEVHLHPKLGVVTPELFLANWLAHDYLHIRQILKLKYLYLKEQEDIDLDYAGEWQ